MGKIKFIHTEIEGLFIIENLIFEDERGKFIKTFQKSIFLNNGINFEINESFHSISKSGVIRGLHYQCPPFGQQKLVYVPKGKIMDIILDLRVTSHSYKNFITVELSEETNRAIFIPIGCAHGFQSLKDDTLTVYLQGQEFVPSAEGGVNPLSLGIQWPIKQHIISKKDSNFKGINELKSPFIEEKL